MAPRLESRGLIQVWYAEPGRTTVKESTSSLNTALIYWYARLSRTVTRSKAKKSILFANFELKYSTVQYIICYNMLKFVQPCSLAEVSMAARTPGNQPTDEPGRTAPHKVHK